MLGVQYWQLLKQVAYQGWPLLFIFARPSKQVDKAKLFFSILLVLLSFFLQGCYSSQEAHSETCQALDSSLDGSCQNKVGFTIGEANEFTKSLQ
jgi:hypothetical protein